MKTEREGTRSRDKGGLNFTLVALPPLLELSNSASGMACLYNDCAGKRA